MKFTIKRIEVFSLIKLIIKLFRSVVYNQFASTVIVKTKAEFIIFRKQKLNSWYTLYEAQDTLYNDYIGTDDCIGLR